MNPIVGIGELLWDVYPDGDRVAGGAPFNFAFHCHQLGHDAVIVSRLGDDSLGRELRENVRRLGLNDAFIQTDPDHSTGTVRVTLDANKVPTYSIAEDVAWDHIAWNESLAQLAAEAGAVCFGTLAQRAPESRATIQRFVTAVDSGIRVFDVNIRTELTTNLLREIAAEFATAHWVKLNFDELDALLRTAGRRNDGDGSSALRLLFDPTSDSRRLGIVTRGARSTILHDGANDESVPAVPARVVDTVGAGDAFTAAMVCLHREGRRVAECARFASHYASRVCEEQGATPRIDRAEVERTAFGAA